MCKVVCRVTDDIDVTVVLGCASRGDVVIDIVCNG